RSGCDAGRKTARRSFGNSAWFPTPVSTPAISCMKSARGANCHFPKALSKGKEARRCHPRGPPMGIFAGGAGRDGDPKVGELCRSPPFMLRTAAERHSSKHRPEIVKEPP